jgi:hypothetical protein
MDPEKPHLIILAEDDANRQLAHAFLLEIKGRMPDSRQIEVLRKRAGKPPKDGWKKTVDGKFIGDQVPKMFDKFPHRMVLLLIDFDEKTGDHNRREYTFRQLKMKLKEKLKLGEELKSEEELKLENKLEELRKRVFVLGVWSEPEQLRQNFGQSFEKIGESLAQACINDDDELWQHELLKHNLEEVKRMKPLVNPLLFKKR